MLLGLIQQIIVAGIAGFGMVRWAREDSENAEQVEDVRK